MSTQMIIGEDMNMREVTDGFTKYVKEFINIIEYTRDKRAEYLKLIKEPYYHNKYKECHYKIVEYVKELYHHINSVIESIYNYHKSRNTKKFWLRFLYTLYNKVIELYTSLDENYISTDELHKKPRNDDEILLIKRTLNELNITEKIMIELLKDEPKEPNVILRPSVDTSKLFAKLDDISIKLKTELSCLYIVKRIRQPYLKKDYEYY